MKTTLLFTLLLLGFVELNAQRKPPRPGQCGLTYVEANYMLNAQRFLDSAMGREQAFTTPYLVKVFVRIFHDDNGSNAATTEDSVINRISQMNGQYSSDNVCFLLVGIDHVNDSYANQQMDDDDLLDSDYKNYLRDNHALSGVVTIFVHDDFVNSGSSGNAYGIPNSFLSVAGWAANHANVNSIYGHEMGHCLGLYHTFQARRNSNNNLIRENVTRSSSNICYNCVGEGDLCCDTPADHEDNDEDMNGCTFIGTTTDACNVEYVPSTRNIMSYMPWECISTTGTAITSDQATRIHATINNALGPIYNRIAADNQTVSANETRSSGFILRGVRTNLVYDATVTHQSSVQSYNAAGSSISILPGATFVPNANGVVSFTIHTVCQ